MAWCDRDESNGNMKNRAKVRHGNGIRNQAGVKSRKCYRSWWCNNVTFSSWSGVSKPKERRFNSPDCISIPAQVRKWELSAFPMSARLRNVLDYSGCRLLGDLHGLQLSELEERRGCGQHTLQELKAFVRQAQKTALQRSHQPVNRPIEIPK
jgi:hypothetical protein